MGPAKNQVFTLWAGFAILTVGCVTIFRRILVVLIDLGDDFGGFTGFWGWFWWFYWIWGMILMVLLDFWGVIFVVLLYFGADFGGFAGFWRMILMISQDLGGQLCHVTNCQDSKSRLWMFGLALLLLCFGPCGNLRNNCRKLTENHRNYAKNTGTNKFR